MVNSAAINDNKQNQVLGNIANDIYFLPNWEIINSFTVKENYFFFFNKIINVNLLRKFVLKSTLEKYSIRTTDNKALANMDIKLYKDCVYIVSLETDINGKSDSALEKLIHTAMEKAFTDTTEKEVLINISPKQKHKRKIKKMLINNGFKIEENQSDYEKNMFGEIYKLYLCADNCNENCKEEELVFID